ncbi:carboxypeptidase-like regulatory domain-containing protein [Halorubrum distributum]|uniref:carboxypeptidase-like regulatory domain-containing protein n=1 Tax=Halorubrum distributum TaxID=29283 RepID=UPI0009B5CA85|nr:carboxypeptidase-like regulatory domain-containing protein [Halorubrum arcis]
MPKLRIYDTKGNAYSPDGTGTGSDERIKELFYGGVRLAVRSDHRQEISLFFRARETRNARTEQFYAVYSVDDSPTPLQDLITDLTTRVESEWGYTIDESSEEMQVYRELKHGNTALPGGNTEQDILSKLVASRNPVTVGVSDERNAIGLLSEYLGEYDQAAIADSTDGDVLSTFDFVVTPGEYRGITPLGETEGRWESTSRSLRDKHIKQEITSIRESVETLSREHGLSNGEIRKRVQSSVPALKAPATDSNLGSTASESDDDYLIPPKIGLYVAIGAVVLLILFAAVRLGPEVLGALGVFGDAGSGQTSSQVNVAGVLINNETNEQISSSTSGISIELRNETGVILDEATQPTYNFTVNETKLSSLTLTATADGYQNRTVALSTDSPGGNISLTPTTLEADGTAFSRVEGQVTDTETGESVQYATVSLNGSNSYEDTTNALGEYTFEEVPAGEYMLSANANGYIASETSQISVNDTEPQVYDLNLEPAASVSIFFNESGTNVGVSNVSIRLIDDATGDVIDVGSSNEDGWYNKSNLKRGNYRVDIQDQEYTGENREISLSQAKSYEFNVPVMVEE